MILSFATSVTKRGFERCTGVKTSTVAAIALLAELLSPWAPRVAAAPASPAPWAKEEVQKSVQSRRRLVVRVYVPLCDNDQIDCGGVKAGDPSDLEHNLYWGAIFGQRRFFSRKSGRFERVPQPGWSAEGPHLERAVFKKRFAGGPWGAEEDVMLYVVLDAFRGGAIDDVVDRFYREAEAGGAILIEDGEETRTERVDVVGYAGHNRMMDGKAPPPRLPDGDARGADRAPIPSFVMACRSAAYFATPLKERGSEPILMTRDLMAPEGYVVDAIVNGLAANESKARIRARVVKAYADAHQIEERVASSIFARD